MVSRSDCPTSSEVAVVIPAFNEAETISSVATDAAAFGAVVVVDDASTDGTASLAAAAGAEVVRHTSNKGYDGALLSGFRWADANDIGVVVSLDADSQHDPRLLGDVLAPILDGQADMVLGVRLSPARWSERMFCSYTRRRYGVPDILCGVKAFRIDLFRRHHSVMSRPSIGTALTMAALREGTAFELRPISIRPRTHGKTRFGSGMRAELRILRAFAGAVIGDVRAARRRRRPARP